MKNRIINNLNRIVKPDNRLLYLLEQYDESNGYFLNDNKISYISKSVSSKTRTLKTKYLKLITNVEIQEVEGSKSFKPGIYDILTLNIDIKEIYKNTIFLTFFAMCETYFSNRSIVNIEVFFLELNDLFEGISSKNYKDSIGLFGELYFIYKMYVDYGVDITNYWQMSGAKSKYDFTLENLNIEVKTTIKNNKIFRIKHDQVFNQDNNYIVVINIENNDSGFTIDDLILVIKETELKNNFIFIKKIEMAKINVDIVIKERFAMKEFNVFSNKIEKIEVIPSNILNISYDYDFVGQRSIDNIEFSRLIKNE